VCSRRGAIQIYVYLTLPYPSLLAFRRHQQLASLVSLVGQSQNTDTVFLLSINVLQVFIIEGFHATTR